jgi:iron(III) transport system ATP-binding protein
LGKWKHGSSFRYGADDYGVYGSTNLPLADIWPAPTELVARNIVMIEVQNLRKQFKVSHGQIEVLRQVNQRVEEGQFFVLLGPSGSGKTTLLRCIAGLETPDEGKIEISGKTVFSGSDGIFVPPEDRQIGMVFQSYAIWPHMTIFENVALPLTHGRKKIVKALVRERVLEALGLVQLEALADRPAPLLSGGQQQRVALARALAVNPKLVLMDEPLSNLDARLREDMRVQIRDLVRRLNMTVLYVTHDQAEAMVLGDRIGVMSNGSIVAVGSPEDLYEMPETKGVAEFFGSIEWFEAERTQNGSLRTEFGNLYIKQDVPPGKSGMIGIRPEDVQLSSAPSGRNNEFEGQLISRTFLGDQVIYTVQVNGVELRSKTMNKARLENPVYVRISKEKIKFFVAHE